MATIDGTAGDDTLNGTSGDDIINGLAGNDVLNGGDGNDFLDGGSGDDVIDGGAGVDTISYAHALRSVQVGLAGDQQQTFWGYERINNVENLVGSSFGDFLVGSSVSNRIDGGAGNDTIYGSLGDDVLTGGTGSDWFLYQAGDGKETITDLSADDHIFLLDGRLPQSIVQSGNDVIIAFSGSDQITCLNTDTATVQAALTTTSSIFVQPPSTIVPTLPPRPSANRTDTLVLAGAATIAGGAVIAAVDIDSTYGANGPYFLPGVGSPLVLASHEYVYDYQLTNGGTIWDSSSHSWVNSVLADRLVNSGIIVAEAGQFQTTGPSSMNYWTAVAAKVLGGITIGTEIFRNSGTIMSVAQSGYATAVYSSNGAKSSFVNSGLIAAQATYGFDHFHSGGAEGIRMQNGGNFLNDTNGQILVEGDGLAWAVYQGRGSAPGWDFGPEIVNRGLIQAAVGSDGGRPSVGIFAVNLPSELMRIVNSGTIKADIAIYCPSSPADAFTTSWIINPQTITNEATGVIIGDIQLNLGDDILNNAGLIRGTVDMGGDNDLVDDRLGIIEGTVLLGEGVDRFIGGASDEHVRGGSGDDTVTGGAGRDLLEGDLGNDLIDGGPGNDGLYGGLGNDTLRTAGADVVDGGYGDDRIETGDYAFARIDGGAGYDTWVLPIGAKAIDLTTVALTGRVINVEEIELRDNQAVTVRAEDVRAISGADELVVRGNSTDTVYLAGNWTDIGTVYLHSGTYERFQSGATIVAVETSVRAIVGAPISAGSGLDPIASGSPAPLPQPNNHVGSNFEIDNDLLIDVGSVWSSPDGDAPLLLAYDGQVGLSYDAPDIYNFGSVINAVGTGTTAYAIRGFGDFGSFFNYGTVRAETYSATTDAVGMQLGEVGLPTNLGLIEAISHGSGDSVGVLTYGLGGTNGESAFTNVVGAQIQSRSDGGFATGIIDVNSSNLANDGLISAFGATGAIAVDMSVKSGGDFSNAGQVSASVLPGTDAFSIGFAHRDGGHLNNSGTITADVAIYLECPTGGWMTVNNDGTINGDIGFQGRSSSPMYAGRVYFNNSGTMVGNYVAGEDTVALDTIVNTGQITGNLFLAGGDDSYNGAAGILSGSVYGEGGNDTLIGGNRADSLFGGEGNDVLGGGGGNDTLAGGAGTDVMTGGAGSDTFIGSAAELNGDTITDLSNGDKIIISDASLSGFSFSLSGSTLSFTGGTLNLGGSVGGTIVASASANGGVQLTIVSTPPVATVDQIASQLTSGYWSGDVHHWAVIQGGTLTVNISTLSADEQLLARAALSEWTDVIGVNFQEVSTGGQIVFDNSEVAGGPVAATDASWANGIISHAHVHISTSWTNSYGARLDTYSFQTYIHEIGHALGLGHPGNYNDIATYTSDAIFQNDSAAMSVMSYFDQAESTYFANQHFSILNAVTPMLADVAAMQALYGLSTTTRPGNTIYGDNSNANAINDPAQYGRVASTIIDSGGNDTIAYTHAGTSQLINLNPETFSSVNGYTGNLAIARGTIIENAVGGDFADTIIGNAVGNVLSGRGGNDTLTGGPANDTFLDTAAGHNGDTITDYSRGDRIVISDATLAGFALSLSGTQLNYTGGSLTLAGLRSPSIQWSSAPEGGVQITWSGPPIVISGGPSVSISNSSTASQALQKFNLPDFSGTVGTNADVTNVPSTDWLMPGSDKVTSSWVLNHHMESDLLALV